MGRQFWISVSQLYELLVVGCSLYVIIISGAMRTDSFTKEPNYILCQVRILTATGCCGKSKSDQYDQQYLVMLVMHADRLH